MDSDERLLALEREIRNTEEALEENAAKIHKLNDRIEELYDLKRDSELLFSELMAEWQGEESLKDVMEAGEEFRSDMYFAITSTEEELENTRREGHLLEDKREEHEMEKRRLREEF